MDFGNLREYQQKCIHDLRDGIVDGHRSQVLVAPTGSGKTVIASYLLGEAYNKGSKAFFICDRVALVDQTSTTLDKYGIPHGVIQASHWRHRPWEPIQVISAQTLARRKGISDPDLVLWDECHSSAQSVLDYCSNPRIKVVGLTATPFSKWMGKAFSKVINCTTTNKLIDDKWLVPLKCFAATEIDMKGAKLKFDGEWQESEIESRGIKIIGDVVEEWVTKTHQFFDGPAKSIVFSATVAHGAEICKGFQDRGYNFQQISYLDGNDDRRRALIDEFRKPDSEIIGLVSCEALAKGFDVTDIKIGVGARPYRKSFAGHIQQMGRVMRPHEGKDFALWLDHSGNVLRFLADMQELFENGVDTLRDESFDEKVKKEKTEEEKADMKCYACGFVHSLQVCPSCGTERRAKRSKVENSSGAMSEIDINGKKVAKHDWQKDIGLVWKELCSIATSMKPNNLVAAEKFALAQYRNIFGVWPTSRYKPESITPRPEVRKKVTQSVIAFRHRMKKR